MKIRIDAAYHHVRRSALTCREILLKAGKKPEECALYEWRQRDQPRRIGDSEAIAITDGMRFVTLPLEQTDGARP